jgi:hypothetical protein
MSTGMGKGRTFLVRASASASPPAAVLARLRSESSPGLQKLKPFPVDIWVDGQNRLRQMDMTIPGAGIGSVREDVDLSQFGTPVKVTAPPKTATLPASSIPGLGGATGSLPTTIPGSD